MKVVLLYDEANGTTAISLCKRLKKAGIRVGTYAIKKDWDSSDVLLRDTLSEVTHIGIIFSEALRISPGFAFIEGFSLGSNIPLICYAHYSDRLPGSVSPYCGIIIRKQDDFSAYFKNELKDWTIRENYRQAKSALLDMGIPFNGEALEKCVQERKTQAALLFLKAGFSPDIRDKLGVPLLNLAVRAKDRDMVNILLTAGASVNLQAEDRGSSALIDCALGKQKEIMADLLTAGADVNLKSKDGQSALVIAVGLNDEAGAEMLLKAGANPDEPDSLGASARKYVALFHKSGMLDLFNAYAPRSIISAL